MPTINFESESEITMTTKSYTCTLTRWHKVAERLSKEYNDLSKTARQGLTETTVSEYLGETQEQRLEQFRDDCLVQLDRAMSIQEIIQRIRQALGDANQTSGVSRELAEYDVLVKRASLLNGIVEANGADRVAIGELKLVKNPTRSDDYRDRGQPKIAVGLLEGAALAQMRQRAEEATAAMYTKADRIADVNKATLVLELPVDIARIAGI